MRAAATRRQYKTIIVHNIPARKEKSTQTLRKRPKIENRFVPGELIDGAADEPTKIMAKADIHTAGAAILHRMRNAHFQVLNAPKRTPSFRLMSIFIVTTAVRRATRATGWDWLSGTQL
jgi:hypothetical protein